MGQARLVPQGISCLVPTLLAAALYTQAPTCAPYSVVLHARPWRQALSVGMLVLLSGGVVAMASRAYVGTQGPELDAPRTTPPLDQASAALGHQPSSS